jgi:PAS domain S-box-containing protein
VDKNGILTLYEGKAAEDLGPKPEEVVGRSVFDSGDLMPGMQEDIRLALAGEAHTSVSNLGESAYETHYSPLFDQEGEVEGVIGVATDITSRWRAERALEESAAKLEETVKERTDELEASNSLLLKAQWLAAVGQVTSQIAHDLRNPLTAINTNLYYLERTIPEGMPPKASESIESIRKAVFHSNDILESLIEYSKPAEIKKVPLDVSQVITGAAHKTEAPEGIRLSLRLAERVPVDGSEEKLSRIFENLIRNALDAMPRGGELVISSRLERDRAIVEVADTGTGIPEENLKKLFTPFFTTKAQGLGMGLAICRRLVEAHGGTIEVGSEEGRGTTVTITLPLSPTLKEVQRAA